MANFSHMTNIIHQLNHIKPQYSAVIADKDCIINSKDIVLNNLPHVYRDVNAGIYELDFNYDYNDRYYVNIYNPCNTGGQRVVVKNKNDITYRTLSREYPLLVYRELTQEKLEYVGNSINSFLDIVALTGKTICNNPGYMHPAAIISIDKFSIETYGSGNDIKQIDLHTELRALPNGTKDIFVMDANAQRAYIIRKVNKAIISGFDEEIIHIPTFSNASYDVYFIKRKNAKFLNDDKALICSHFKTVSYNDLINKEYSMNVIALSDDYMWRHEGFYLKIDKSIASDVSELRTFINRLYNEEPLTIVYPLMGAKYEPVLLDEYHIKTYFGGTHIICHEGYDLTYFYKSILL